MTIKETKKQIVGCNSFSKDWKDFLRIEYVDWKKDWTYTTQSWETRDKLVKVIKFVVIDWTEIFNSKEFAWKENRQICQELSWKSLIISTKIG